MCLPYAEPVSCRPSSKTAGLEGWPPAASVHRGNLEKSNELEPEATRQLPHSQAPATLTGSCH